MDNRQLPSAVRRVVLRPATFLPLLTLAFALAAPPLSGAAEAHEVLRYDLFTNRHFGNNGEDLRAAAARDGQVLVVWTEFDQASVQATYGQWLAPDGTPSGETFRVANQAGLVRVAVKPGRRAIVLTEDWRAAASLRVVTLQGERVVRRGTLPDPSCGYVLAVTATERGWFVACELWGQPDFQIRRVGWWLDPTGRARHQVEIEGSYELVAAGGVRQTVALVYRPDEGSPLFARWITPWRSGPEVVVDPSPTNSWIDPAVTHLRDRVFAVSWVFEQDAGYDGEDAWRVTSVHEATFRAPGSVRAERRFSPPSTAEFGDPVSEHRRPFVLRTGDREQLVGWFGCQYGSSPGGRLCFRHDGLYLRARRDAGPAGPVIALPDVAWNARVVYTGDLLLTATLVRKALNEDRWSLEIRGWEIE